MADRVKHESKLLAEVAGLKENNRELAKSLAEKRKENTELKELHNKYVILENKFVMNQEMHLFSISCLETYLTKTSSQLFEVVENLSHIHKTLHETVKRSVMLEDKKEENKIIGNDETLILDDTHTLEHISGILQKLSSNKMLDSLDEEGMDTPSPHQIIQNSSEKVFNCKNELELLPEVENNIIPDIKVISDFSETKILNPLQNNTYPYSQNKHVHDMHALEECKGEGIASRSINENSILYKSSQLEKIENSVVFFNEGHDVNDTSISVMVNSVGADTYHYSQDEAFQNFLADDETIIRRGIDESLGLSHIYTIPITSVKPCNVQYISNVAKENIHQKSNCSDSKHQEGQLSCENHIHCVSSLNGERNTSCTNEDGGQSNSDTKEETSIGEVSRNHDTISRKHVANNTKLPPSNKNNNIGFVGSEARQNTKLFNALSKTREELTHSYCFRNSNFCKNPERKYINNKSRRSGNSNDYTIYSDPGSPNADTEKYLRRYNTLINLNEVENSKHVAPHESCSGKENTCSITYDRKFRQSTPDRDLSRKPLHDRRKDILTDVQNIKPFEKKDVQISLGERNNEVNSKKLILPQKSISQDTKEESLKTNCSNKKLTRKGRRKSRLKRKENLRL